MNLEQAWLLPALCMGAFAVLALGGRWMKPAWALLAVAASTACFVLFWPIMAHMVTDGARSFSWLWFDAGDVRVQMGMTVDALTVVMLGLMTAVTLAVQVFSLGYMRGDPRFVWYYALLSFFAAAMLALVLTDNLLVFYVTWELVGLGSYLLIGFWYERRSAAEAAKKAFITTRVADVALLTGILVLFQAAGTFELAEIVTGAQAGTISHTSLTLGGTLIVIGAMGKSAQAPFHVWLPDAMEGPTPVSALIHAATMVAAGVYLVARMLPVLESSPGVLQFLAAVGLITVVLGAALAFVQNDIKKVLAYSTISQLGFMMLALGAFGYTAAIFHLLTHGFFKALLFLGAGSVIHGMGGEQDMRRMGGLAHRMPVTAVTFLLGAIALAGVIPASGFFSKDEVLAAVLHGRGGLWYAAALAASSLTALYMARLVLMTFSGEGRTKEAEHAHESPAVMVLPLVALMLPAVALGALALHWGNFAGLGTFLFLPREGPVGYEFHANVFWPSVALVLAAGLAGIRLYFPRGTALPASRVESRFPRLYRALEEKLYFDAAYQWVIDRVVLGLGRLAAAFDRRVVNDTGVDGAGKATALAGRVLRLQQTGQVSVYLLAFGVSALAIIITVVATA